MRQMFKRLTAVLLLVCLLTSFVVPATFADTASTETSTETTTYDFVFFNQADYASLVTAGKNTLLSAACGCGEDHTVKDHLDTQYDQLGWKFAGTSTGDYSFVTARATSYSDLLVQPQPQAWLAITLKVPVTDSYAISLVGTGGGQSGVHAYLFNGGLTQDQVAAEIANTTTLPDHLLKESVIASTDGITLGSDLALEAGECTLVFKSNRTDKSRNLFVKTINLTRTVEEEPTEPSTEATVPTTTVETEPSTVTTVPVVTDPPQPAVENVWNFDYYNDSAYAGLAGDKTSISAACGCGAGHTLKEHLDTLYSTSGWKIAGTSDGNYDNVQVWEKSNSGMLFQPVPSGWIAITLWVTASGKQTLYATSSGKGQSGINTYIFEGELSETQIAEKLADSNADANLVRKGVAIASGETGAIGSWDFTPGAYTLVIRSTDASRARNFWLRKIELGEFDGVEATVPSSEPSLEDEENVWHFDYYNYSSYAGLAGDKTAVSASCGCGADHTLKDHLDTLSDDLGWKIAGTSDGTYDSVQIWEASNSGMLCQPEASGWIAITLQVNASGKQTLYATASGAGQSGINTYIFEGALTQSEIAAKLASTQSVANLVRKGVQLEAGATGAIGSWDFTPGAYTLVIRNTNASKARNFWLRKIELGEFDGVEATAPSGSEDVVHTGVCDGSYTDGVFNFALYTDEAFKPMFVNSVGSYIDLGLGSNCANCGKTLQECLAEQYASNQNNWNIEATTFYDAHILSSNYSKGTNSGLRLRYMYDGNGGLLKNDEDEEVEKIGNWVAFRVKLTTAGNYAIYFSKEYSYAYNAEVYIFSAPAQTMSNAAVEAAMTAENRAGKIIFGKNTKSTSLTDMSLEAGEYIVVMKTVDKGARIYLNTMTFEPIKELSVIDPVDKMLYEFDLSNRDANFIKRGLTGTFSKDPLVYTNDLLSQMYENGEIYWNYEVSKDSASESIVSFRDSCLRWKSSDNFKYDTPWTAFRIKNPGTGTYDIRIATSATSSIYADIYIFPATVSSMDAEKIESMMTEENLLVKNATFPDKGSFYMGEYTFGMEEEYIVVIHMKKGVLMYLKNIQVTRDGLVADETISKKRVVDGTVYDFDLCDAMDGIIDEGKVDLVDYVDDIEAWYASGVLNWKWADSSDDLKGSTKATMDLPNASLHRIYRKTGMRFSAKTTSSWTAFKIKSPGSGTFTVTMNYAAYYKSGTIAVYVVPADSEDIWGATDSSNRIGKVCMSEDTTSYIDGRSAFVGYYDFEAGKEYILVFECYALSLYSTHCYTNISQLVMERGRIEYEEANAKTIDAITVAENAIPVLDPGQAGAVTKVNGHDYYVLPCEGGVAMVYDLQTRELVDTFKTGQDRTQDAVVDQNGIVYLGGSTKSLVIYDPYTQETKKVSFLGREEFAEYTGYFSMCAGDDGKIYLGLYYGSGLAVYDPETEEMTYLGQFAENGKGTRGLTYHNGYLYFSVWNNEYCYIHKYDIATGQIVASCDVKERKGTASYIQFMTVIDDSILMASGMNGSMNGDITIDIETMELMDTSLPSAMALTTTAEVDGIYYFCCVGNGMYQYDKATKEFSKVPGFGSTTVGMRSHDTPLLVIDGHRYYFTYKNSSEDGFHFYVYDMDTLQTVEWDAMEVRDVGGASLREPMNWEPGSNLMSFGAFNIHELAIYDIEKGEVVKIVPSGGQTDSQVRYNGTLYVGAYSATVLDEIDTETETITQRWKLDHSVTGQKRIHTLTAGDDKIFAGTIPNTNVYGGAIVVYDTTNGEWFYHRHVIENQSILKLLYHDKLLFGASSRMGGSGSNIPIPEDTSAVIFVYDYETREVIATLDPRDYISGLASPVLMINALAFDPNFEENGRFWAVVSETLFTFTYDRETKEFDVKEIISFDKSSYATNAGRTFFARNILFDTERNYIYFAFDTAGFQRLTVADLGADEIKVTDNMRLLRENPMGYTMGEDGNIYYASDDNLMMFPLNVTDEDWAIAEEVDNMIDSIAYPVTLECEADIKNARSAYDNLSWYYKALVQNAERLQELETDFLEARIDAINLEEITADSLPLLKEMRDEYDESTERQQRYTKNYDHLKEAYDLASQLNDERIAAAMQERIDALEPLFPMTLEVEPTVVAIRTDYNILTKSQQELIDITLLLKAEEEIAVLRAEFVKYVESLIQAIPEVITLEAEPAITAAREGVDKLYVAERKEISYSVLTMAESKLRVLQNAKAAADETDALIKAIGIVTLGDKDRIAVARASYDALSETALQFLTRGKKLQRAEFTLKALQTWGIPVITVANAGVVFAVLWFVPSLHKKVFKNKKKETEEVDS